MIFAAGLGTRLKPLTDHMPKALVEVGGKPLLERVIGRLADAGFDHLVVNVHHFSGQIIDYLRQHNNFGLDIKISDETDALLDTGGGIRKAQHLFDPRYPILIHNVDILSNINLAAIYDEAQQSNVDALLMVSWRKTKRYLLFDEEMILDGWTNIETGEIRSPYPAINPSNLKQLAFSGIHIISPHVFPLFQEMPERFGIIDFYLKYCHQCAFMGKEMKDLRLMDVGKIDTLSEAEQFIQAL